MISVTVDKVESVIVGDAVEIGGFFERLIEIVDTKGHMVLALHVLSPAKDVIRIGE